MRRDPFKIDLNVMDETILHHRSDGEMLNTEAEVSIRRFLESFSLEKLKQQLERERLPKSGLKSEVVQRILQHVTPQRILLHTHDDDVIRFAEQCNYRDSEETEGFPLDGSLGCHGSQEEVRNRTSTTSSIQSQHLKHRTNATTRKRQPHSVPVSPSAKRSCYDLRSDEDLVQYRALADNCRLWILKTVWGCEQRRRSGRRGRNGQSGRSACRHPKALELEYMEDIEAMPSLPPSASPPCFFIEEVPLGMPDSAIESLRPIESSLLSHPVITHPSDDEEDGDSGSRGVQADGSQAPLQQQQSCFNPLSQKEMEKIKSIVLTTFFARLELIRRLLLLDCPSPPMGFHEFAVHLVTSVCTSNSCPTSRPTLVSHHQAPFVPRDLHQTQQLIPTASIQEEVLEPQPPWRVSEQMSGAVHDVKCLLWDTVDSFIGITRLQHESILDCGAVSVTIRLIELSQYFDFQPAIEQSVISLDARGAIRIRCRGFYYHTNEPIGPFVLQLALISSLKVSGGLPGNMAPQGSSFCSFRGTSAADETVGAVDNQFWCIRALQWECF